MGELKIIIIALSLICIVQMIALIQIPLSQKSHREEQERYKKWQETNPCLTCEHLTRRLPHHKCICEIQGEMVEEPLYCRDYKYRHEVENISISSDPIITGRWIQNEYEWICSQREKPYSFYDEAFLMHCSHYCPNCGAKMEDLK